MTGSIRFLLIVLAIFSLVALPCCERRDKSATDLVGAKYVAYRRTLQDFEVRTYVLVVDPGPDGYMQTENKLTNLTNSLSNGQRLDFAVSVLAAYNGVLKQAAEEMDDHLEKLKDAGLAVIEAVHRLPRPSQPSKVETDANSLVDTADKLASSLHTCKDVRQRLLQDIIDMKGDVRGVFAQRVALGKADEWPKLQAGLTEQFDRFQQQKEQCVRTMRRPKERLASRLTSTMPIHLLDRGSLPFAPLRGSRVARRSRTQRAPPSLPRHGHFVAAFAAEGITDDWLRDLPDSEVVSVITICNSNRALCWAVALPCERRLLHWTSDGHLCRAIFRKRSAAISALPSYTL